MAGVPAQADVDSHLEYGIGLSALSLPHYPGSDEQHELLLPFPFITYRSPYLEIDRSEVRGRVPISDRLSLDISTGGSLPVRSGDNEARSEMPNLHWVGEVGPGLRYIAVGGEPGAWRLALELPLRRAASADGLNMRSRGWTMEPNVDLSRQWNRGMVRWHLELRLTALAGSTRYYEYYYGVPEEFATSERPAFRAEGGFNGFRTALGLSARRKDWWFGGFVRYTDLSHGDITDSPLLRSERTVAAGIAVARVLGTREQSGQTP
jgi:MipA family protein